jgi:hypothetical protein
MVVENESRQHHALSGAGILKRIVEISISINHVLVHAPRNAVELDVAMAIVKAAIQYMIESRDQWE